MSGTSSGAAKRWRCPRCGQWHRQGARCSLPGPKPTPWVPRLWALVDTSGGKRACWPWRGAINPTSGYGQFGLPDGSKWFAHRLVWWLTYGDIPDGAVIRHTCDNPPCCNPRHLLAGTQADNQADMVARGRSNRGSRHWNSRLTLAQVVEIRESTERPPILAQRFSVSANHIRRIQRGERWTP